METEQKSTLKIIKESDSTLQETINHFYMKYIGI